MTAPVDVVELAKRIMEHPHTFRDWRSNADRLARAVIAMAEVCRLAESCQERIGVDGRDSKDWRDLASAIDRLRRSAEGGK